MKKEGIRIDVVDDGFTLRKKINVSYTINISTDISSDLLALEKDAVEFISNSIVKENVDRIVNHFIGDTRMLREIQSQLYAIGNLSLAEGLGVYIDTRYVSKDNLKKLVGDQLLPKLERLNCRMNMFEGVYE